MSDNPLPLSRPSLGEEEIREVLDVIGSGWITSGPRVKRFEEEFSRYVGARHAVAVNSCTAALHVALLAHGMGSGDEVVTSSMTWSATVNMIEVAGAKPVFADVDRETLQITPETVAAALTERTRAILPVHFAGQACDLDRLVAIATNRNLTIIQDAAHAVGTEFRGRRIGGGGVTACFSFHPIKNITTGEGGMITTDSDELAEKLRLLRFHGVNRDAWSRYGKVDSPRYETVTPGWKYNLTDLQAALGIHQLAKLDSFIERRTRLADLYHAQLAEIDGVKPLGRASGTSRHAWHLFVVTIEPGRFGCDRDRFMQLMAQQGVGTGLHFTAVHLHDYYRSRYGYASGALPNTEWASDRVVSLPLFPGMNDSDVSRVCEAIRVVKKEAAG
ncbi:MAG TPA: aminotransferase class I/II-fold pyridoxal phosphate-dependent enzyme [Candidatus Binatia bacterium]